MSEARSHNASAVAAKRPRKASESDAAQEGAPKTRTRRKGPKNVTSSTDGDSSKQVQIAQAADTAKRKLCSHPLRRITASGCEQWSCDACGRDVDKGETLLSCRRCDYDVCMTCAEGKGEVAEMRTVSATDTDGVAEALKADGVVLLQDLAAQSRITSLHQSVTRTATCIETALRSRLGRWGTLEPGERFAEGMMRNKGRLELAIPAALELLGDEATGRLNAAVATAFRTAGYDEPVLYEYGVHLAAPGCDGQQAHRDDEAFGLSLLLPLQPVDALNGATQYWPRTHTGEAGRRWEKRGDITLGPGVRPALRTGEGVLFLSSTVHRGTPNRSEADRVVLYLSWAPKGNVPTPQREWNGPHESIFTSRRPCTCGQHVAQNISQEGGPQVP